jgi:four helix bundle protein
VVKVGKHDDFRDLKAWEKCREIRREIWLFCKGFSKEETYRLCDQMIRASRSSTACITEGYGRFHYQETIQFCRQARGSLYELIDHLDVALGCGYIDDQQTDRLISNTKDAIRLLNGYIKYLQERKDLS